MVQAHRTSSNLLEHYHYRDTKECRVLLHEFGVVRLYRTLRGLSSGWFKHIEPPRTFSNHIIAEITRSVEFYYMSSGWFDYTEPSLPGETRCAGCLCTSSGWFKHIEPRRTFSSHIITEIVRCVEFCHMSSGWFDCTEPSLSTSLQR